MVDTGAAYSEVLRSVLEALGCRPVHHQRVVLADGRVEEYPLNRRLTPVDLYLT